MYSLFSIGVFIDSDPNHAAPILLHPVPPSPSADPPLLQPWDPSPGSEPGLQAHV